MSHDTDKLIRQLSLVAFLMAERRPLTARDVKQNVEGYSEMSDEAFARRFYSDRAELIQLGVPLDSQRDEFTGEELYSLRSERYFLPPLELSDDELAALQTCLYLLEGQFAYAEPLRLALQNLALGRPGFPEPLTETEVRVEVFDPDYSAEMPGRLAKLESAISKQRTVRFEYWSISRDKQAERPINPYALLNDNGIWYLVGHDVERKRCGRSVSRASAATSAWRRGASATSGSRPSSRSRSTASGRPGRSARPSARRGSQSRPIPPGGWSGRSATAGASRTASSSPSTRACRCSRPGCCGRTAARCRSSRRSSRRRCRSLERVRERHEGEPPRSRLDAARAATSSTGPAGPVAPERFGVLQALLAYLLDRCGEENDAEIPASELVERFRILPRSRSRSTCRCSTSSTSAVAATPSTRS